MYQIIIILEKPQNWLYTFFILFSIAIWLLSLTGFSKSDSANASLDLEADFELEIESESSWGDIWGFGALPLAVWLTLLLMLVGLIGIMLNEMLLPNAKNPLVFYPLWAVYFSLACTLSLLAVRKVSKPLSLLFIDYGVAEQSRNLAGKIARISSGKLTATLGEATLEINGHSIEVAVRLQEGEKELAYGQQVLLLHYDEEKNVFWCHAVS